MPSLIPLTKKFTPEEVEEVLFNDDDPPIVMRGKEGRYLAYGKTREDVSCWWFGSCGIKRPE